MAPMQPAPNGPLVAARELLRNPSDPVASLDVLRQWHDNVNCLLNLAQVTPGSAGGFASRERHRQGSASGFVLSPTDFQTWSEHDESLTDGEDLHLLLGEELEEDDEDDASWEENFSSSEKEVDSSSIEEDSVVGGYLLGRLSEDDNDDDDDEEAENSSGFSSDSGGDDGGDDDGSDDDSDVSTAPPIKRCRVSGTY
ncbi:general transcription factor IIF subunit 1-like [Panicum hallii]|uniref:general transcription factor IIF subunit 1-like n=1 Tax=Panicum hallii TaxID=206008 RepID=UPI000DF4DFEE|nr:general transcription factor IIF subunit 1-like [Panicum hallii]